MSAIVTVISQRRPYRLECRRTQSNPGCHLMQRPRLALYAAILCSLLCGGLLPAAGIGAPPSGRSEADGSRQIGRYTGQPLPRFAALRSDPVNLRRGPGKRYPIKWVLHRRFLPVEIMREFQAWRFVRIPDGTQGWVHRALLVSRRRFMVRTVTTALREAPRGDSRIVALLRPGVIGRLIACQAHSVWCRVKVAGHAGYLRRTSVWGTLPANPIGK
jgi:SH3-like domain-containing protein